MWPSSNPWVKESAGLNERLVNIMWPRSIRLNEIAVQKKNWIPHSQISHDGFFNTKAEKQLLQFQHSGACLLLSAHGRCWRPTCQKEPVCVLALWIMHQTSENELFHPLLCLFWLSSDPTLKDQKKQSWKNFLRNIYKGYKSYNYLLHS